MVAESTLDLVHCIKSRGKISPHWISAYLIQYGTGTYPLNVHVIAKEIVQYDKGIYYMGLVMRKSTFNMRKIADSRHHAHAQSLILAFALYLNIQQNQMILFVDSEGPDQTAHLRSLIRAFSVRTWPKSTFLLRGAHIPLYSSVSNDSVSGQQKTQIRLQICRLILAFAVHV